MFDIDKAIKRIYPNHYEHEGVAKGQCRICGELIFSDDDYYEIREDVFCERCVGNGRRSGG